MNYYLGVDLGATTFKFGLIAENKVLKAVVIPVHASFSKTHLISLLIDGIQELIQKEVQAIGIGVPGVVDPLKGLVYNIQNLPQWQEVNLVKELQTNFDIPIFINNDANCFAKGQLHFGQGVAYKNFVGLSIGTGLGMGIIINKELYNGVLCGAGEIGMVPYLDGVLEDYAASFFFPKFYNDTAQQFHERAQEGDLEAIKAFKEFGKHLGEALKIINYLYAPEAIILGGSIAKAYPFFKEIMIQKLNTFAYPKQIEHLEVLVSTQKNVALLGAASLCLNSKQV